MDTPTKVELGGARGANGDATHPREFCSSDGAELLHGHKGVVMGRAQLTAQLLAVLGRHISFRARK